MQRNELPSGQVVERWTLTRDIAVLQVKLIVDGLRDFLLVPISIVAGLISLFSSGSSRDNEFYRLLRIGRKSEKWINLFGAADRVESAGDDRVNFPQEDIDTIVKRLEDMVVDEYRSGGVTKQARDHLEQLLSSVRRRRKRNAGEPPPQ